MKKLLVPTNLSEEASYALEVATFIAKKTCAEVVLLNILEDIKNTSVLSKVDDTMIMMAVSEMKQKLLTVEKNIKKSGVKIKSEVDFDSNNHENVVEMISNRNDCDLIVIGAKENDQIISDSKTDKVVQKASVPVLAVKKHKDKFEIKKVLFPTDFEDYSEEVISFVKKFTHEFNAELHLLFVNTPKFFADEKVIDKNFSDFIKKFELKHCFTKSYSDYSEENGILNYSQEINADVIFMPTNGRSGFSKFLHGSITSGVINHGDVPVLTINTQKSK